MKGTPSPTKECPGCGNTLPRQAVQCAKCDWRDRGDPSEAAYQQCAYEFEGLRCPLPGAVANHVGKGGPWWCRHHFAAEHEAADRRLLEEIVADPARFLPQIGHLDRLVDQVRQQHPEWERQIDEGRSEYMARMKAIREPMLQAIAAKGRPARRERPAGPTAEERERALAELAERAQHQGQQFLASAPTDLLIEDLAEAIEERAAKHQARGVDPLMAQRLALEDELRARVGRQA